MKPRYVWTLFFAGMLGIYCALYMVLRLSHVLVHYYGYDICRPIPISRPWAWHDVLPARNINLYPIYSNTLYPARSEKEAYITLGIHYTFKPLSASEELFWYLYRPYWGH